MRPVFKQARFRQQLIEPAGFVAAQPGPQYQVGRAGHDVDGVDLQHAHAPDHLEDGILGGGQGWSFQQSLGGQHNSPSLSNCEGHAPIIPEQMCEEKSILQSKWFLRNGNSP